MKVLIVGAGVTGCFTAARLAHKGVDVSVLARGDKAARLERDGLSLRDAISNEAVTVRLNIVRAPIEEEFDIAMVCVQAPQQASLAQLLSDLPGRPTIWYLGNSTQGYDAATSQLGRDRVLGGFPGVGGTWEDDVLVYADREKPTDKPFDRLIIGEAHRDAAVAADAIQNHLQKFGMNVERHVPIMAWHWCHIAMVLPLAGVAYQHDLDLHAAVADRALLIQAMRAASQGLAAIRRAGYPILPRGLNVMRWIPATLGARRITTVLQSEFGRIAIVGHATTAREEMHGFATDLLALAGANAGADLREVLESI
ncbi:MAG: NAD-binding protein [Gammaproteobacteria bacterium]|nr:NAD-binding protein [Gammaproteobacteria bacterium]